MALILNNDEMKSVLTMEITMKALEEAYREISRNEAVCRVRIDIQIPTEDPKKIYQWGTMEGGSTSGYFAIRMKSDIVYEQEYLGARTQENYCVRPGKFCGLILLINIQNGEPLALINDGYLQHMRVGADSGIGVKYMAREDAQVVGMLGSGGMARSHMEAFTLVRPIRRLQVYSPTKAHREEYAKEMAERFHIEAIAVDDPREVYKGANIIAGCTDSTVPVIIGKWLEEGTHITCVGGMCDEEVSERIDAALRFGNSPAPIGLPEFKVSGNMTYAAMPDERVAFRKKRTRKGDRHGVNVEGKTVLLAELVSGAKKGRTSPKEITFSARGNLQGRNFFPSRAGPTSWPSRKGSVRRYPPSGCCRTSGIRSGERIKARQVE